MNVYLRPHHEVHPELAPDQDFLGYDEESGENVGRVFMMSNGHQAGCWLWTMTAHSNTGRVPFQTSGVEDKRDDVGRRVLEAYRLLLAHNQHDLRIRSGMKA